MSRNDRTYFLRRAETELNLARAATHEKAARAHFLIAGAYFDRVYAAEGSDSGAGGQG